MRRRRKRKCCGCGDRFEPAACNRGKQRHCGKPACRRLGAQSSQKKWLSGNRDYFRGSENILRVQQWRKANPGYWRGKSGVLKGSALQENCIAQVADRQQVILTLNDLVLQESWITQPFVLAGLISTISGLALQEDLAAFVVNLQKVGREILGTGPGTLPAKPTDPDHEEKNHQYGASSARPAPVQLGRSPPDPAPVATGLP